MRPWMMPLLIGLALQSCSYSARRGELTLGGQVSPQSQKVFVPVVDNLTVRTGYEASLTNSLRAALSSVRGVSLVENERDADLFLLGSILKHDVVTRFPSSGGTKGSAEAGGLAIRQSTAADLKLTLRIRMQLVEKVQGTTLRREVWSRDFEKTAIFEASSRRNTLGNGLTVGSASAPHINDAREQIQVKILSDALAQQVLDQVVQDF